MEYTHADRGVTVTNPANGAEIPVITDTATFPDETWYRVSLDITGESGEWEGVRIPVPALTEREGSAALSLDIIYRWRSMHTDAWYVQRQDKRILASRETLEQMASYRGEKLDAFVKRSGIDLLKPDRPARTGYGQPFYVELVSGGATLDAYFLDDGEPLDAGDDEPLGFYGKKRVTLYVKDAAAHGDNLALHIYVGEAGSRYRGNLWFGPCVAAPVTEKDFPPELICESMTPPRPFTVAEAAVSPIDPKLIPEAAAAMAYLKGAAQAGHILYGVQNYPFEKGGCRYRNAPQDTSDVFDMTGTDPSVFGFDSLSFLGLEKAYRMPEVQFVSDDETDPENLPLYIEACALRSIKAWKTGTISTLSLHMSDPGMVYDQFVLNNRNPVTGRDIYNPNRRYPWSFHGYGYGNSTKAAIDPRDNRARSPHTPMLRMYRVHTFSGANRTDIGTLEVFNAYLDMVADYCLILQKHGVPVLFRPFHENSGDWFWWGNAGCENADHTYNPDIFKRNWRHIVEYMYRRGVHNCIYVYSPNGSDFDNEAKKYTDAFRPYAITYPGDRWVDICAFDDYTMDEAVLLSDVEYVTRFAAAHGKLAAATEVTGNADGSEPIEMLRRVFTETPGLPENLAYYMQWRPARFMPYLASPSRGNAGAANTFIKVLGDERVVMANETAGFTPERVIVRPM